MTVQQSDQIHTRCKLYYNLWNLVCRCLQAFLRDTYGGGMKFIKLSLLAELQKSIALQKNNNLLLECFSACLTYLT